jgi:SpoVK/Ycf46/Vps4 family AAA+-type ATPase
VLCRVIASQAAVPLIYVPLEAVASKWYGESERNLAEIFKAAEQLGGAIIFLDEIDSLATQRRWTPATDPILSLRSIDGFDTLPAQVQLPVINAPLQL